MPDIYGMSDVGCVRELNEDSFCIQGFENSKIGFCVLADGMGGHNAGEVASQNAVKYIADTLKEVVGKKKVSIPEKLNQAIDGANKKIFDMAEKNIIHRGMRTTVVAVYADGDTAYIANIGDSRAYAVRNDEIVQITNDHSVVAELVNRGMITSEEARMHPQKNIITRAVGTDKRVSADIFEYNYSEGDTLIVCSDGLSNMLTDKEIFEISKSEKTAKNAVNKMIETAKDYGGIDNITAICLRFNG